MILQFLKNQLSGQGENLSNRLTDFLCLISLVGIWPRFIEPRWLETRLLEIKLPLLPSAFNHFKIAHLSDLHLHSSSSSFLLKRVAKHLADYKPDLIIFTGDFSCYSRFDQLDSLESILTKWQTIAPLVCCLGNHDYEAYVTQREGLPSIEKCPGSFLFRALKRLLLPRHHPKSSELPTQHLKIHPKLDQMLKKLHIACLQNSDYSLNRKNQSLVLWGVSDLWAGGAQAHQTLCDKIKASKTVPTIILAHNPESSELLKELPACLILSGHTHGGTINLPWVRSQIRSVRDEKRLRGLHQVGAHQLYINRGLGSPYPLRWFSRPELTLITLRAAQEGPYD